MLSRPLGFSIWLIPAKHDAKYLNDIIKHLAKQYNAPRFLAHITLFSGIKNYRLAKNALDACHGMQSICTKTTTIRYSNHLWKTVFVNIKNDKNLKNLNLVLQRQIRGDYIFDPHVSLIYKKMSDQKKKSIKRDLKIHKTLLFDKITIIKSSKNVKKWKKLVTIKLENKI